MNVRIIPLGGVGEFGMNTMLIETDDEVIVIDAGLLFPDHDVLGVDLIVPDISYLVEREYKVKGIILTHGHEDHIGGLPFMLQQINAPVFGTKLTLALVESKLREFGLSDVDLVEIEDGQQLSIGDFNLEFIRVFHSIPDCVGLAIHTKCGTIVHSGDFKLDQTPVIGEVIDLHKFAELGEKGVRLLLSDSTNSERAGYSPSERSIFDNLDRIFHKSRGRIFAATFASSIYRIQQFIELAIKYDRRIAVVGRSMVQNIKIAKELGYLWFPESHRVELTEAMRLPPEKVMIFTTGSQGEPLSALSLMAMGNYKVDVEEGDSVIISARVIPGNEKAIGRVINNLYRRGAEVYYERSDNIHVSGHACAEELKLMLNLVKPDYFMPIHGEYRQLLHHARIAQDVGLSRDRIIIPDDGMVIEISDDEFQIVDDIPAGKVFIDGRSYDGLADIVLRDRRQLARDGMLIPIVVMDNQKGNLIAGPDIVSRGFIEDEEAAELMDEARDIVISLLEEMSLEEKNDVPSVQEEIRVALRRFFSRKTSRRPMVIPVVMRV